MATVSITPVVAQAGAPSATQKNDDTVKAFHRLWYGSMQRTWAANRWMGIETAQNPMDVWITQESVQNCGATIAAGG